MRIVPPCLNTASKCLSSHSVETSSDLKLAKKTSFNFMHEPACTSLVPRPSLGPVTASDQKLEPGKAWEQG